jgi:Protein of unknown function (DUF2953)
MFLLLAVVAAAAVIGLLAPVRIDVELDVSEPATRRVRVEARWLLLEWRGGRAGRGRPARRPRSPRKAAGRRRLRRVLAVLGTPGFVSRSVRLVLQLLRQLRPKTASGWIRFGFDDPVSTGVLFGAAQAVTALTRATAWDLQLEPDFAGPAFAGRARLGWTVRPGSVLWPVGTFAASPTTWRAVVAALRTK